MPALAGRDVTVLIWTTTPWTIPANLAIAFHPDFDYGAYEYEGRVVIVAEALAETRRRRRPAGRSARKVASFKGAALERVQFRHPFYERDSLGVLGDYVTLDQGTGAVHTAPGTAPTTSRPACGTASTSTRRSARTAGSLPTSGVVGGLKVFEANPVVEAALAERGRLWFRTDVRALVSALLALPSAGHLPGDPAVVHQHGRPARRRRSPRPTPSRWIPDWGRERMTGMFVDAARLVHLAPARVGRADSRRSSCQACGESLLTPAIVEQRRAIFETHSADAWYELPIERVRARRTSRATRAAARRSSASATSSTSGSTRDRATRRCWRSGRNSTWPADLYLEGTDQYRGWFQSSLLVGVGTRDRAPYRACSRTASSSTSRAARCRSRSATSSSPQQVIKDSGADVLRLWVSMVDYRDEVRLGKAVLARTVEAYRKIRNTFRYLLSNLYDFDPARDAVAGRATAGGRSIRAGASTRGSPATCVRAYEAYDFQAIFHAVNEFVTVDLSAFYLDVSKDRLYTFRADSRERRSAQTALYVIADGLARLLAPILSVTADEIWAQLPGAREASVHLAEFPPDVDALAR